MQKIISLFQRNYDGDRLVRNEVVPGAEWVLEGEGVATQKHDGTCCSVVDGRLFKRYEAKKGKAAPWNFVVASEIDPQTGKQQGWVPVGDGPEDRWHREAFEEYIDLGSGGTRPIPDGTYELCGPKVQGNPERLDYHMLIPHGSVQVDAPRTFRELKKWFATRDIEGIVWHHEDGRMVKIKAKDFGIQRVKY